MNWAQKLAISHISDQAANEAHEGNYERAIYLFLQIAPLYEDEGRFDNFRNYVLECLQPCFDALKKSENNSEDQKELKTVNGQKVELTSINKEQIWVFINSFDYLACRNAIVEFRSLGITSLQFLEFCEKSNVKNKTKFESFFRHYNIK